MHAHNFQLINQKCSFSLWPGFTTLYSG
uniref:Uncharacterized protein n=1 Tax=Anguilla anguilla TaxID=7936 RepID=A0A0E9S986_ANGAN